MAVKRRTLTGRLRLLFHKDERVTQGGVYPDIRKYDFSSYLPVDDYISPQQPPDENVFDIRDFGAVPGNESTDCAPAVNAAIEAASRRAGAVLVDGGEYSCSQITLKSGVTLFIASGSCIRVLPGGSFPNGTLLFADGAENIAVTGGGKLFGCGELFGRRPIAPENMTVPRGYVDVPLMRSDYRKQLRFAHPSKFGGMIVFKNCTGVSAQNFVIEDSPYWTFRLDNCRGVKIRDLVINNNRNVGNADGIDLVCTCDAEIEHCFISTADDGIVLKNAVWEGGCREMSGVTVSRCEIISRTNGFKIGTETTHDISRVRVEDCRIFMTDLYPGTVSAVSVEAVDGSRVSDIKLKNIRCSRCSCPLFIRLGNRNRAALVNSQSARAVELSQKAAGGGAASKEEFDMKSRIFDITVDGLFAEEAEIPVIVCGFRMRGKTVCAENIRLKNLDITMTSRPFIRDRRLFIPEYAAEYPEANRFGNLPAYGIFARHVRSLSMENCKFSCADKSKKERYFKDVK